MMDKAGLVDHCYHHHAPDLGSLDPHLPDDGVAADILHLGPLPGPGAQDGQHSGSYNSHHHPPWLTISAISYLFELPVPSPLLAHKPERLASWISKALGSFLFRPFLSNLPDLHNTHVPTCFRWHCWSVFSLEGLLKCICEIFEDFPTGCKLNVTRVPRLLC